MSLDTFIHATADVHTVVIGAGSRIWQFVVVLAGAQIGDHCNICAHCFIENDVIIGDRVTIKNGVQIWDGSRIEDDVFIGPNVSFTNDRYPKSGNAEFDCRGIVIREGASIGAAAVILPGIEIGARAMVGAGAVVVKDVEPGKTVVGNPARIIAKDV